jgi:hypothetical protein
MTTDELSTARWAAMRTLFGPPRRHGQHEIHELQVASTGLLGALFVGLCRGLGELRAERDRERIKVIRSKAVNRNYFDVVVTFGVTSHAAIDSAAMELIDKTRNGDELVAELRGLLNPFLVIRIAGATFVETLNRVAALDRTSGGINATNVFGAVYSHYLGLEERERTIAAEAKRKRARDKAWREAWNRLEQLPQTCWRATLGFLGCWPELLVQLPAL